jgi:hypothetical protein
MAKEKKVFKSKFFLDLFYEVMDEYWLDEDTYVIIFQDMTDSNGDTYHLEVEYHKDEEEITYTRVYEFENVHDMLPTHVFKKQIDEYILQQVGVIGKNDTLIDTTIEVKLRLAVPLDMKVCEYEEYLDSLFIEINRLVPTDKEELINKVKVLRIEKKK